MVHRIEGTPKRDDLSHHFVELCDTIRNRFNRPWNESEQQMKIIVLDLHIVDIRECRQKPER